MSDLKDLQYILKNINIDELENLRKKTSPDKKNIDTVEKNTDQIFKESIKKQQKLLNDLENKTIKIEQHLDEAPLLSILKQDEIESKQDKIIPKSDVRFKINLLNNDNEAYISIYNLYPDFTISKESLFELLNKNRVKKGIITDRINELFNLFKTKKNILDFLIAKGRPPTKGEDSYFKYIVKNDEKLLQEHLKERGDLLDEKYIKHYSSKGKIITNFVKKNDILIEKIEAVYGESGYNVTGKEIPPINGEDFNLKIKRNVIYDPEIKAYKASTDGQVIIDNHEIWIRLYKEGHCTIKISDDEMKASLIIYPSIGNAPPIKLEDIKKKAESLKITISINENSIIEAINISETDHIAVHNILISEGIQPVNGKDGYFEYKIKIASGEIGKELKSGRIDYKEKDLITTVRSGDLLAILHKGEPGIKDGKTVLGRKIEAQHGNEITIKTGKNISQKVKENIIEFYSDIDGHLKIKEGIIAVLPFYLVQGNVDLESGNIDFPGDIIVKGNVLDEFKIKAQGDIIIHGNAGSADIESDMDIIIKKGVFGKSTGKIITKGTLYAKFIENGFVEAVQDVIVDRAIINSEIYANRNIIVAKEKGQIIGSKIFAGKKIEAKIIGSQAGVKTELNVGYDFILKNEKRMLQIKKTKYTDMLIILETIIQKLLKKQSNTEKFNDKMKKIYIESIRKKTIVVKYLNDLTESLKAFTDTNVILCEKPEVIAYHYIFTDVKINLLNEVYFTKKRQNKLKLKLDYHNKVELTNP